ncbi:hypothetical protein P9112_006118 [Eukaryota sp. TZLM1-RC]
MAATYCFSEGLPLTKVSSGTLLQDLIDKSVEHFQLYGQVFQLPSYTKLQSYVGPRVVISVKDGIKKQLTQHKLTGFCLAIDGSEVNGNSLINFCLIAPGKSIFWKAVDAETNRKNETYLTNLFETTIQEIGPDLVNCVITDAAPNYLNAANNLFNMVKVKGLRCAIHTLNSFMKDILEVNSQFKIDSICQLIVPAIKVVTFVLKPFIKKLMRKVSTTKKLKRIATTRFYTHFLVLERVVELYPFIAHTLTHEEYVRWLSFPEQRGLRQESCDVKRILANENYWTKVEKLVDFMKPLVNIMQRIDSLTPIMGKLYRYLQMQKERMDLTQLSFISEEEHSLLLQRFEFRILQIFNDYHRAAFCLDPEFRDLITEQQFQECRDALFRVIEEQFGRAKKADIIHQWSCYVAGSDLFEHSELFNIASRMAAHEWWYVHGGNTELSNLAVRLLSMVTSNSEAERNWSDFRIVCTQERNKMESQRATDSVMVKHYVRGGRSSSKKYWDRLNGADVPNEPDELEVSSGVSSDEDVIEIH